MYNAKQRGRNTYQFFNEEMNTMAMERLKIDAGLRQAIEKDELFLCYQPKVNLDTKEITGIEALLRWRHPEMGMVPPAKFIPVAEETGLIGSVGLFVLREACRQAKLLQEQGMPNVPVAVNLSAKQLRDQGLLEQIKEILENTGLAPTLLELELTESIVMNDAARNVSILKEMKQMGLRLTIDDFGTGYCSLSYLKQLPVDTIKIDRSFVADIVHDDNDRAIVTTIIAMANHMNLNVIAEGVETVDQLRALRRDGCHEFQGIFLSEPVAGEHVREAIGRALTVSAGSA